MKSISFTQGERGITTLLNRLKLVIVDFEGKQFFIHYEGAGAMNASTPSTLTSSMSMGMYELENSVQELISDTLVSKRAHQSSMTSDTKSKDRELVQALRDGDETAFNSLITRYHSRLVRLAGTYVRSEAVAEEVAQETWLAVWEGIDRFEGRASLKTWLFQILTNRAKTRGIRESRYVPFSSASTATDAEDNSSVEPERFQASGYLVGHWAISPTTWDEKTPERLLLSKEGLAQIEEAIHALPANLRQVIILRDIEGIDSEETCQMLQITATNQRVLLHRARSKVRKVLSQYLQGQIVQT